jgi:hypothetical protein
MILTNIDIVLPSDELEFFEKLFSYLEKFGELTNDSLTFYTSKDNYFPIISIKKEKVKSPKVRFYSNKNEVVEIAVSNITGKSKRNPSKYSKILLDLFCKRIKINQIISLDHVGFNLPWFEKGLHPEINKLRKLLSKLCLYHLFPSGQYWDFIIPASKKEIEGKGEIDYSKVRKPKFEIVSFGKCSDPLIQIEVEVSLDYEKIVELFPGGIHCKGIKNVWVYIDNPYGIDICLVLNQVSKKRKDWSEYFADSRLIG